MNYFKNIKFELKQSPDRQHPFRTHIKFICNSGRYFWAVEKLNAIWIIYSVVGISIGSITENFFAQKGIHYDI